MASTIKVKRSSTASAVPSSLAGGELAANTADGKLFLGKNDSSVVEIGAGGGSNFQSHKFTTAETWAALDGLASETITQVIIDASGVTEGSIAIDVDGSEQESFPGGHALVTRIFAPSSDLDIRSVASSPTLISSDADSDKIYLHSGITSTISSSFASPYINPSGLALDSSGNLISTDYSGDKIYKHSGITSTISTSFSSPGASPQGLTVDGSNNLISSDVSADKIYKHSGITASITTSFASPSGIPRGLAVDSSGNLIHVDASSDKIYKHSGITSTITTSFSAPYISPTGLAIDNNDNLVSADSSADKIYVHSGITSTISSSFASPGASPSGVALKIPASGGAFSGTAYAVINNA